MVRYAEENPYFIAPHLSTNGDTLARRGLIIPARTVFRCLSINDDIHSFIGIQDPITESSIKGVDGRFRYVQQAREKKGSELNWLETLHLRNLINDKVYPAANGVRSFSCAAFDTDREKKQSNCKRMGTPLKQQRHGDFFPGHTRHAETHITAGFNTLSWWEMIAGHAWRYPTIDN
jgi:hypothetical protein